jgi:multiple sugar transport system permease protein
MLYLWFLAPMAILLFALTVYPVLHGINTSFTNLNLARPRLEARFIGLDNYLVLYHSETFRRTVANTLLFVGGAVALQFAIGFGLALLLNRNLPGRGVIRTLLLLPLMVTPVVAALIWSLFYNPSSGIINQALIALGVTSPPVWLGNPRIALLSIIIVDTWQWSPFVMLLMLAGLQTIPKDYYEAAQIDGASGWACFRHITIPVLMPLIGVVLLFRIMDAFKVFEKIYVLTGGGPGLATETIIFHAYRQGFGFWNMGYASAIAVVAFLMVVAASVMLIRATQQKAALE